MITLSFLKLLNFIPEWQKPEDLKTHSSGEPEYLWKVPAKTLSHSNLWNTEGRSLLEVVGLLFGLFLHFFSFFPFIFSSKYIKTSVYSIMINIIILFLKWGIVPYFEISQNWYFCPFPPYLHWPSHHGKNKHFKCKSWNLVICNTNLFIWDFMRLRKKKNLVLSVEGEKTVLKQ